ncbi:MULTISPECIES: FecCD family ABC transporter permease [Paenibacillus]|uniref:Probable heme-iron transport system permease protein IsdF n=1 Tax=Paenibacillus naphthalenovorans TaxID=162209 RepID=A0A0U2W0Y9_9BACL|nr:MULTISPECIES: iron ABC transporter permease [Paenibacillus]ALS21173.1 ABC transporter permease [Paenibacillus naphthalenovorans]GCL72430.1 iron ABC transporter permease [Paenibacillus naphthalenovorans]SDI01043.1 iron complex transport system permease protein [Paenibacillus naphthalenovorans]
MNKIVLSFTGIVVLLLAVTVFSVTTGSIKVGGLELIQGLFTGTNKNVEVIKDLRLPRIIVALFVGASLAVSGVLLQAVMRSSLADAGVIGISSGAGFISVLFVTIFPTFFFWLPLFAFIGGALACFLVYSLSWKSGLSPIRIILVGIAINATFTGLGQSFNYRGSYAVTTVNQATTSIFTMKTWSDVQSIAIYGSIGLLLSLFLCSWCNLLSLQDKSAKNLGLNVSRARLLISAVAVLLAAVSTAIGGLIAFVGLLVPHIARLLVGSDHRVLIPFSALAGALLILTADTLGRTLLAPAEIPASIIMTVIGGPFLIFLLRKSDRVYGN